MGVYFVSSKPIKSKNSSPLFLKKTGVKYSALVGLWFFFSLKWVKNEIPEMFWSVDSTININCLPNDIINSVFLSTCFLMTVDKIGSRNKNNFVRFIR
jgi:hypothetical protein